MLGTSKPIASLSSGLLARKGQARPAMRPQGFHGPSVAIDDLGWNDMGDEAAAPSAPPVAIVPPVLVEREALREEIELGPPTPTPTPAPVSAATASGIARDVRAAKGKAAFTLRLDPERHLRLRLASASRHRSAQALVVAALDAYLATLPEVEGLALQLSTGTAPAVGTSRGK